MFIERFAAKSMPDWTQLGQYATPFRRRFQPSRDNKRFDIATEQNPMALLQISEPGQSPDPHQRRIAVGIDLGTTHSLVAAVRTAWPNACRMRRAGDPAVGGALPGGWAPDRA
jgi:hypothetical protein